MVNHKHRDCNLVNCNSDHHKRYSNCNKDLKHLVDHKHRDCNLAKRNSDHHNDTASATMTSSTIATTTMTSTTTVTTSTTGTSGACSISLVTAGQASPEKCGITSLEECASEVAAHPEIPVVSPLQMQDAADRPPGCWWQPSDGSAYFNTHASEVVCTRAFQCVCCTATTTTTWVACSPRLLTSGQPSDPGCAVPSLRACSDTASEHPDISTGVPVKVQDTKDRPSGCWWQPSNGQVYYNVQTSTVPCSETHQCLCCGGVTQTSTTTRLTSSTISTSGTLVDVSSTTSATSITSSTSTPSTSRATSTLSTTSATSTTSSTSTTSTSRATSTLSTTSATSTTSTQRDSPSSTPSACGPKLLTIGLPFQLPCALPTEEECAALAAVHPSIQVSTDYMCKMHRTALSVVGGSPLMDSYTLTCLGRALRIAPMIYSACFVAPLMNSELDIVPELDIDPEVDITTASLQDISSDSEFVECAYRVITSGAAVAISECITSGDTLNVSGIVVELLEAVGFAGAGRLDNSTVLDAVLQALEVLVDYIAVGEEAVVAMARVIQTVATALGSSPSLAILQRLTALARRAVAVAVASDLGGLSADAALAFVLALGALRQVCRFGGGDDEAALAEALAYELQSLASETGAAAAALMTETTLALNASLAPHLQTGTWISADDTDSEAQGHGRVRLLDEEDSSGRCHSIVVQQTDWLGANP
eukprot:CAMPEP_0115359024 /NCGR_PEP_ID=MMETSP0270-20121206/100959_1 /TAXON_ID=71861 /ORGANISM="Scrippsiella trochoidea, Strain CCMP3099" /LENGTH=706 /DNA_ID=CAMNT_0002781517 /DNA_START=190 /DNA_END=2311 /DNA_ORIENTATION=+